MELLIFVVVVAVIAVAFIQGRDAEQKRLSSAAHTATQLGLELQDGDEFVGSYEGYDVRLYSRDHGSKSDKDWWWCARATLAEPPAAGLTLARQGFVGHIADAFGMGDIEVGGGLDSLLKVACPSAQAAREVLRHPPIVAALHEALLEEGRVELLRDELFLSQPGRHTECAQEALDELVRVAQAFDSRGRGAWILLAREWELEVDDDIGRLAGEIEGVTVLIEFLNGRTRISTRLRELLPADTLASHVDEWDGEGEELRDPILDAMIRATSSDMDGVRDRLCRDAIRGPVLDILHGRRGSRLLADRVELWAPGRLGAEPLRTALAVAIELTNALDA